ncbi:MAG TPA: hypothetical protein VF693_02870 [Allosphingosinicella sp.]|jgi:tetratricopeptide (TPR) repeat protein
MRRPLLPFAALLLASAVAARGATLQADPPASGSAGRPQSGAHRPSMMEFDIGRILNDRAHAEEVLRWVTAHDPPTDPIAEINIDAIRGLALAGLGRREESRASVDRLLARRSERPFPYIAAWFASLANNDWDRLLAILEAGAARLPPAAREEFNAQLMRDQLRQLIRTLGGDEHSPRNGRLLEALAALNWPGDHWPSARDEVRKALVDRYLGLGDRAAAARFAPRIEAPMHLLDLLLGRRYDGLHPHADPLPALRRALEREDRATAAALAARPGSVPVVHERAQHLSSVGRSGEALAVLEPLLRDVRATVAADEDGMWAILEAVNALLDLGRRDEAVALMERLVALDLALDPQLIGARIDHVDVLRVAGRPAAALAYALRLRPEAELHANAGGQRWVEAGIVCSLVDIGRRAEAAPYLAPLQDRDDSPMALTMALLCLNDLDAAAALLVRQLGSDDPGAAIQTLQEYEIAGAASPDPLAPRMDAVRRRPEVVAALARVGRALRLPLSRSYWANF